MQVPGEGDWKYLPDSSVSELLQVGHKDVFLPAVARILFALALVASLPVALRAQTIQDGVMLSKGQLFTGGLYARESWDQYWEGPLKRENENIGTITTQANIWYANYGLTNRLNVIGAVPYVWTQASQGVLHGIDGFQDLTLAAKYHHIRTALRECQDGAGHRRAVRESFPSPTTTPSSRRSRLAAAARGCPCAAR